MSAMTRCRPILFLLMATLLGAVPARAAEERQADSPDVPALLRRLDAEALAAREAAFERLFRAETVTPDVVRRALASAGTRARPLLLELSARRGLGTLVPEVVEASLDDDPITVEAALRALVLLGPDAVAKGLTALRANHAEHRAARAAVRLLALARQREVELALTSKWRRKAGSYRGRYSELEGRGWYVQAVLMAMLLDVPLEDRFVVVDDEDDKRKGPFAARDAIRQINESTRRGYRTFEPLPPHILDDDLFEMAQQALRDVADMDLVGDVLEMVASDLLRAHDRAPFQLRPFEKHFAEEIASVLYVRGRKRLLEAEEQRLLLSINSLRKRLGRPGAADWALPEWVREANELAATLHAMERFEEAAKWFQQVNEGKKRLGGEASAIVAYNRACSLALAGKSDDALAQLDAALALGTSDLTREWVTEDGDLRSLHADPRFEAILVKHFESK
jgi:tetratricopeptide (TPR) repeat protein